MRYLNQSLRKAYNVKFVNSDVRTKKRQFYKIMSSDTAQVPMTNRLCHWTKTQTAKLHKLLEDLDCGPGFSSILPLSLKTWKDNKIQQLSEATQNLKVEDDYKGLNWETKRNKYDRI